MEITIELAQEVGCVATKKLKPPHDLEYEKTFYPFALFAKKRYVGMMYEFDPNKCKRKSMGIVLKRRDNAPIVKHVFGNVIERTSGYKKSLTLVVIAGLSVAIGHLTIWYGFSPDIITWLLSLVIGIYLSILKVKI